MPRVAVSSVSQLAADAGARVADVGGNAVDAAVAAAFVAATTAPGMCSLGGAGFALIAAPGSAPEAFDGGFEMPGRGLPPARFGGGRRDVHLEYAGGVDTTVGAGSVATPGALALLARSSERHGSLPWAALVEPAREIADIGFPLPDAAHAYLTYAHESIFGWNADSHASLHDETGDLLPPGATIRVPHLAESLAEIGDRGAEVFYVGRLAEAIAEYVQDGGGLLGPRDLAEYEAVVREPIRSTHGVWDVATNPPPAVGGVALAAMLELMLGRAETGWSPGWTRRLARVQEAVLQHRSRELDASDDLEAAAGELLERAGAGELPLPGAPSTVHTSAVDDGGLACAITLSDGYGSGAIAPGTGIWLNNTLGEPELNPHGYHGWPPGHRLLSNMAPTVARHPEGGVLAIGSPGADRITTALVQVLVNHLELGMSLQEAIDHPRLHVELTETGPRVVHEPGIAVGGLERPLRGYEGPSMYFGGVSAARWDPTRGFDLGSDGRRTGGAAVGGS
ncbi:MAG: gamma-glutamyltransferase [Gemmatimonadota bacterium]|nr:gamma-glutamyltransferase [Gemmatimonadota bacterium]